MIATKISDEAKGILLGIRFPLRTNDGTIYVSQAAMKTEAIGILLGPNKC